MDELIAPRTDAGVVVQVAVVVLAWLVSVLVVAVRLPGHRSELIWLFSGVAVVLLALFGLRALH